MEIVNKFFKRKGTNDSADKIINVESGFAIFNSGARCKLETLLSDFEIVEMIKEQTDSISLLEPNPDTFFNVNDSASEQFLQEFQKNPNIITQKRSIEDKPSVDLTYNKVITNPIKNDFENRLFENINEPYSENSVYNGPNKNEENSNYANPNIIQEPAEYKVFSNVKKTEELEISIPFNIKLPKAQKIDVLNDMFESSFIEFIAKKEVENLLKNPNQLISIIEEQLTDWLDITLYGKKKVKKKPIKKIKSTPLTKIVSKESKLKENTETIKKQEQIVAEDDMFRKKGMVVNDVPGEITNDEQLKKVEEFVIKLNSNPSSLENDTMLVRYEDMIALYKTTKEQ